MSYLAAITIIHTALCLIALAAGVVAAAGLLAGAADRGRTNLFLATAALASLTGFLFPFKGVTPAQIVGLLALAILAVVWLARDRFGLAASWRWIYAGGVVASVYLLAFVLIAQAFKHVASLHALAPNGNEPPFGVAQALTLVVFVAVGFLAARRFHPASSLG